MLTWACIHELRAVLPIHKLFRLYAASAERVSQPSICALVSGQRGAQPQQRCIYRIASAV